MEHDRYAERALKGVSNKNEEFPMGRLTLSAKGHVHARACVSFPIKPAQLRMPLFAHMLSDC